MPSQTPQRMWNLNLGQPPSKRRVYLIGGGVNVGIFSLKFLWDEHKLFRNFWSVSNDGFDLAKYGGTAVYLPPHKDQTYVFWWDPDYNQITRGDYWRTHPSLLLAYRKKVIIRPQKQGNYRTKKVFIKPPSTITSQWRFQQQWMTTGLFLWGLSLLDWERPFMQIGMQDALGIVTINNAAVLFGQTIMRKTFTYAFWADTGIGNFVMYKNVSSGNIENDIAALTSLAGFRRVEGADDLPYWITTWGQNQNWDWDDPSDNLMMDSSMTVLYWYECSAADLQTGTYVGKQRYQFVFPKTALQRIAFMGPFVQRQNTTGVNIPIMYKSYWRWGGATLNRTAIEPNINFAPSQVSVKNPATVARTIITPWDCDNHGILTNEALERFFRPCEGVDERRPLPIEEYTKVDEPYTSSASEADSEGETDEEDQDEQKTRTLIKHLQRRVQREQHQRHRLFNFLKSLMKQE